MNIRSKKSLKEFNTFGIDVYAKQFIEINALGDLLEVLYKINEDDIFLLGGGSNMLLTKDLDKTVLFINNKGITIIKEDTENIIVEAQAGEIWHELVIWSTDNDYGGLENLALIPGHVGAAPIQNIGAYGVELVDTFVCCKAVQKSSKEIKTFYKDDCNFGYRDSIFKNEHKDQYIITSVQFLLSKKNHSIKKSYGAIQKELLTKGIKNPKPKDIAQAVIRIRQSKLPNPKELGNSGSFFKNPIIDISHYNHLQQHFPNIPCYPVDKNHVKVPAGWLIENCGLKGYRKADAGVHHKQALVLVNHGKAKGEDILELSKKIQQTVKEYYDIHLQSEVNIF